SFLFKAEAMATVLPCLVVRVALSLTWPSSDDGSTAFPAVSTRPSLTSSSLSPTWSSLAAFSHFGRRLPVIWMLDLESLPLVSPSGSVNTSCHGPLQPLADSSADIDTFTVFSDSQV